MRHTLNRFACFAAFGFGTIFLMSCTSTNKESPQATGARSRPFGKARNGEAVELYTLTLTPRAWKRRSPCTAAIVTELHVPDRNGKMDDVVLGFDNLDGLPGGHPYFGALVGRYGNRIAKGRFTLDGKEYKLAVNNGPNRCTAAQGLRQGRLEGRDASDGRAGAGADLRQPGRRGRLSRQPDVDVTYTLTDDNELKIDYTATTDKDTVAQPDQPLLLQPGRPGRGDVLGPRGA